MALKNSEHFNASVVELSGSNLIEASAGTGKTYSIAILVLRLLLEKQLNIKEILMVTFTKAAVAELEERIRLFVRLAYKVAKGQTIADKTISEIVSKALTANPKTKDLLKEAVLFLDETSVLTIHSFCQQTLNEFAFETNQLFGADLLQDSSKMVEEETNKFWRKNITSIPNSFLTLLVQNGFQKNAIVKTIKNQLGGSKFFHYEAGTNYCLTEKDYEAYHQEILKFKEKYQSLEDELLNYIEFNIDELTSICESNTYAKRGLLPIENAASFLQNIKDKKSSGYINKLFPNIIEKINEIEETLKEINGQLNQVVKAIMCMAIDEISEGISYYKHRYNQLNYDDLIVNLHQALVKKPSERLKLCLQQKYKAVFVDEFQDTDRLQYEIFEAAFAEKSILFYIGDPKQSIYAWRKADIFTYFKAKDAVNRLYGMNQNYRSSESLIKAMNVFFKTTDTFHFKNDANSIEYIAVESPENNKKGNLRISGQISPPIQIIECSKKDEIYDSLCTQIIQLLSNKNYQIEVNGQLRNVLPQDIGILIRTKQTGIDIKNKLIKYGIPAITIDDGKVLQSAEALYLLYVLEAINEISNININKALLSVFTGFSEDNILALDGDLVVELFRNYKALWDKDGIYAALKKWIADFSVEQHLLKNDRTDGERTITNLYQLIELLHKTQSKKNLNSLELISWFKRGIEGMETEGDEFEQRIENDEEAIKIVTIHKSKGLEYKIVFAPSLDLLTTTKHNDCSFRDPETGDYIWSDKTDLNAEQTIEFVKQTEQENRRLIYVAVTRAVSQCYIYRNTAKYYQNSSLQFFTDKLKKIDCPYISFTTPLPATPVNLYHFKPEDDSKKTNHHTAINFKLSQENWRSISYSMLRADHQISLKPSKNELNADYDHFIFSSLKRGAKTGNMLHYIFENIQFNNENKWANVIENAIDRFVPQQKEAYTPMLMLLLQNIIHTPITVGEDTFKLADVNHYKCINEFEFDFNFQNFIPTELNKLSSDDLFIETKAFPKIEGIMNGKIDLFFEHQGKYYVLDWKSNYLGDSVNDYTQERLLDAMNENNYHLQYLIYSLAVKKYLESRIPNFNYKYQFGGVIYLFVRGMRNNLGTGIFTNKPSINLVSSLNHKLVSY